MLYQHISEKERHALMVLLHLGLSYREIQKPTGGVRYRLKDQAKFSSKGIPFFKKPKGSKKPKKPKGPGLSISHYSHSKWRASGASLMF